MLARAIRNGWCAQEAQKAASHQLSMYIHRCSLVDFVAESDECQSCTWPRDGLRAGGEGMNKHAHVPDSFASTCIVGFWPQRYTPNPKPYHLFDAGAGTA